MQFKKPQSNYPEIKDIDLGEFQRLCQEANDKELSWAQASQRYSGVECVRKETFAKICSSLKGKSNAENEKSALCSEEWVKFIENLKTLELEEIISKANKNIAVRNWETARTVISLKKQELNRL